ncbi:hypothetical protein ACW2Q0_18770 [Nocardia sp. R16R-3T]
MASIRTRTSKRDGNITYQLQYHCRGKQPSIELLRSSPPTMPIR